MQDLLPAIGKNPAVRRHAAHARAYPNLDEKNEP